MMRGIIGVLALALCFASGAASAQSSVGVYCQSGTTSTGAIIWSPASSSNPCPVTVTGSPSSPVPVVPGTLTLVPLDISTVTTGGTAVTALNAAHRAKGGWLQNPPSATINLCINEQGTASGTTSSGNTTCIVPGQAYALAANGGAVSVVSSDSSHPFSGMGFN
jgi:hypothetical protein